MSSLFADYWREKGHFIAETDQGFMSAIIHSDTCYVDNFYVRPESRGTNLAFRLTLQVIEHAKNQGCTMFAADVYKSDPMYNYNVDLHKHFGMEIIADTDLKTTTSKRI